MRWLVFFILGYVALGVQAGLAAPHLRVSGAPPNVVLIAVIFVAVNAPREAALLGCFVLGVMQDLLTTGGLGVFAFSYGLVGMFVVSTQEFVYRDHPLTHFSLALMGGVVTGLVVLVHGWVRGPWVSPVTLITSAAYTAVLAVVVLGVLQKFRRAFAFQPSRRRTNG
jgi:rod shape-determining protein MreD